MAEFVEARSLSSLNALAANPPQYPVNPAGKRQDPLTLYISRVPGTRDVILSTFKPQIKNVTSQDVANSLYYVHLDAPEDELLVSSSSPPGKGSGPSVDGASIIPRKPVAGQAAPAPSTYAASVTGTPEDISPSRTPNPVEPAAHVGTAPDPASLRRPDQLFEPSANTEPPMRPPQPPIHRKPLGPRTPAAAPAAAPEPANNTLQEPLIPPGHILPPRPDEMDDLPGASQGPFSPRHDPPSRSPAHSRNASATLSPRLFPSSRSPSPNKRKPFTPFSLTVIRRDPASGQQWNVGKVASFQLEHPEWIIDEKYVPSPSISIHLETSGYNKFRGMPTSLASLDPRDIKGSLDIMRPGATNPGQRPSSSPERIASALAALAPPAPSVPHHGYHGFERQVKMGYGPSWTANIREAFRKLDGNRRGDDALATSPPQQRRGHDRSGSATSVGSFGGDFEGGDAPVITYPGPGLRPQGYVFQSPWGGRCEFRTGNGGRSLRCRHVLPNMGGGYNPLVDAPPGEHGEHGVVGGGHGGGGGGGGGPNRRRSRGRSLSARPNQGYDISELRFNLPSSELFGGKDGAGERPPDLGRERMRDRLYNQMHNRTESDVDDDEYYETGQSYFSDPTSLGREKAGGGNRGKRAKMGKLIVAEEGLKMLDLVVAANVGIWWSVWERRTD